MLHYAVKIIFSHYWVLVENGKFVPAIVSKCGGPLNLSGAMCSGPGLIYAEKILYLKQNGFDVSNLLTSKTLTDIMTCILRKGTETQLRGLLELSGNMDSSLNMLMKHPSLTKDEVHKLKLLKDESFATSSLPGSINQQFLNAFENGTSKEVKEMVDRGADVNCIGCQNFKNLNTKTEDSIQKIEFLIKKKSNS